ncbi:MAG: radical SAM proteinB12-binding domain-containing radical SAM protein [Methanophagales archaeon ANME-1-THS]|nr:MAG: radical SAM proteinB12-binding domain-containing radical SAM protein [Methanophagales archaeon ANME-1-THS]
MSAMLNSGGLKMQRNPKIVLTADETMMSQYRWGIFVGFSTCMPQGIIPDWFFFSIFSPPVPRKNGRALYADYGLRIVEAILAAEFGADEVAVVHPRDLEQVAGSRTEIIGVSGHDYLGISPPTSEFVDLLNRGPPYNRVKFFELMKKRVVKDKTVVAGGKGAWQLADEGIMDKLGIDHVFLGECEVSLPEIFKSICEGEQVPRIIIGKEPNAEAIPPIRGATIHGLVEISRGCGRRCSFCTPDMHKLRFKSIEHIVKDVKTNIEGGQRAISLHSEDLLRYGAKGLKPNEHEVLKLIERVAAVEGVKSIGASHVALATVYHNPGLVTALSETCYSMLDQDWLGSQTGIETGSERLIALHMRGKALPSPPEKWPEIVKGAFGILDDNTWFNAATLINGLPGETVDDVLKSIELVDELKGTASLIVPMNFVSMRGTMLDNEETFTIAKMTPEHWQLMGECLDHNLTVMPVLLREYQKSKSIGSWLLARAANWMANRLKRYVKMMKQGQPPTERKEVSKWLNPDVVEYQVSSKYKF